jgi:anti-sigma regulatory factor (Ser/Thr protein kinase)
VAGTVPHVLRTHRTFPCEAGSPAAARRFVRNAGRGWGFDTDDVELVVTELATNVVQHAGSRYSVELCFEGETVTVEVSDDSGQRPERKTPRVMESGGRGLLIVDTLSKRWGVREGHRGGKVVWADIEVGVLGRPAGDGGS